jgi:hypothetical protein
VTYEKDYIGKGRPNEKFSNIVKFSFNLKDLMRIAHEYNDEMYVTFETAAMQNPDKYRKTHVARVRGKVND